MEGELAGNGMTTKRALTLSGSSILGVALYRLLTDDRHGLAAPVEDEDPVSLPARGVAVGPHDQPPAPVGRHADAAVPHHQPAGAEGLEEVAGGTQPGEEEPGPSGGRAGGSWAVRSSWGSAPSGGGASPEPGASPVPGAHPTTSEAKAITHAVTQERTIPGRGDKGPAL